MDRTLPSPKDFARPTPPETSRAIPTPEDFAPEERTNLRLPSRGVPRFSDDEAGGPSRRVVGGLVRGLQQDPILGGLFNALVSTFPDAAKENIDQLVASTRNSTLADVAAIVGEYGPSLVGSVAAFNVGRNLAVKGLAKLGAKEGVETALGRLAGRQLSHAEQVTKFGERGANTLIEMPGVERAGQIVGGSLGFGTFAATEKLADGAPVSDALKAGLANAALAGAFEGALFGLTSLPVLGLKSAKNPNPINDLWEQEVAPFIAAQEGKLTTKLQKLGAQMNKINGTGAQQLELFAAKDITRPEVLAAQAKKIAGIDQARKVVQTNLDAVRQLKESPFGAYTHGQPYNPQGIAETLAKFRLATFQTPDSMKGQFGRTVLRFMEQANEAETYTKLSTDLNKVFLGNMQRNLGKALGFKGKQTADGRSFLPAFQAWEEGGEAGVRIHMQGLGRAAQADDAVKLFEGYDKGLLAAYKTLADMGAEPILTEKVLAELGVAKYVPHILDNIPETEVVARLTKKYGARVAQFMFNSENRRGLSKFGSIDWTRRVKGSLAKKTEDGLPFNANPFDATFQYLNAVARRTEYGKRFGFSGEIQDLVIEAAKKEGANSALVHSLTDIVFGHQYYDRALHQFSKAVTGLETGSKLGLAVIPNMSQSVNTLVFNGVKNFTRGLSLAMRGENKSEILQSVALAESVVEGLGRTFGKTYHPNSPPTGTGFDKAANVFDSFAHHVLKYTGFTPVEKWNRVLAGATGYHVIRDTLYKSVGGRLRGQTLDVARRRFQTMGLDLNKMTQQALQHGDDYWTSDVFKAQYQKGMFGASTATQFNPNVYRKPLLWNHPVGRVMSQFKTFALGQGRFLRDQVLLEAKHGNLAPMAYFLSVYPVAGEVVAETKAFAKMQDRKAYNITGDSDVDRVLQDFTMVGGIGLLSDLWTSARFGDLSSSILGPAASDAETFFEAAATGSPEKALNHILKLPFTQAVKFGVAVPAVSLEFGVRKMQEYLEAIDSESGTPGKSVIDVGRLRTRPRE